MESQRTRAILAAVVAVIVFVIVLSVTRSDRSRDLVLQIEPIDPSDEVTVYVGGAVADPGLYSLPRGSRVQEAIELAGALESADTTRLALASIVRDEQSIILSEVPEHAHDDSESLSEAPSSSDSGTVRDSRINLNAASAVELQSLPGIGPAIAERILAHRNSNGAFSSVDELSDVSGISDRMVDELRPLVAIND